MTNSGKPKVFISYTWLDKKEIDGRQVRVPDQRAFDLAERLRKAGFDSRLDLYFRDNCYGFVPPERVPGDNRDPWIIWAEEQIRDADCVLLFCTPEYVASDPDRGECPGEWCNWHQLDDKLKLETDSPQSEHDQAVCDVFKVTPVWRQSFQAATPCRSRATSSSLAIAGSGRRRQRW